MRIKIGNNENVSKYYATGTGAQPGVRPGGGRQAFGAQGTPYQKTENSSDLANYWYVYVLIISP